MEIPVWTAGLPSASGGASKVAMRSRRMLTK